MFAIQKRWKVLFLSLALLAFLKCSDNNIAGNTSDVGNVKGRLAKVNGAPAVGVTVYFYPVDNNPKPGFAKRMAATLDSTTTDSTGYFTTTLDSGTYNMLAGDDTTKAYKDSITLAGDTVIIDDTLKRPGSLTGTISLEQNGDPRTVLILVFGTRTWTAPDANGKFDLSNMAEGNYHVRLLTTLDKYAVIDTNFNIVSGNADTLQDSIILRYTGIPTVHGVGITYDTLLQVVYVVWNKDVSTQVAGYRVYRRNVDSNTVFAPITGSLVADTVFRDSTGVQDQTYEYKVVAVDNAGNEGLKRQGVQKQHAQFTG